ncbi:MAG: hypothetical protein JOZ90_04700 [Alphaproteobacteria bacterium]|nr:hypothetical protein [Alphaproteobacteria bacterium]MBV9371826.1 hypothetical protein [Alphaproteobacteria bacterium]MBV9900379.1 hypothetical protein [Alphaproteobacteria bacterium]
MDLGFLRRASERFASRRAASVDFGMLLASLRTEQAASPAVRALAARRAAPAPADPLAEILLGGPAWQAAVAAQGGSFNPRFARQGPVN